MHATPDQADADSVGAAAREAAERESREMIELLERYTSPELVTVLANAVAVDYLRKMNVDERPHAMRLIESMRPDVAAAIRTTYPQHCT